MKRRLFRISIEVGNKTEFMRFQPDNESVHLAYLYHPFLSVKSKFTFVEGAKMVGEYVFKHYSCMLFIVLREIKRPVLHS